MTAPDVKICGLTRPEDAQLAAELGAAFLGCNLYADSSRYVAPDAAAELLSIKPGGARWVAVLVNPTAEYLRESCRQAPFDILQFHGDESADFCEAMSAKLGLPYIKAIRAGSSGQIQQRAAQYPSAEFILLDAVAGGQFGGTGKTIDWQQVPAISQPLMLAGGLDPDNVGAAIRQVNPNAVDLASGVESSPGIKDHAKLGAFMAAVKANPVDATSMPSSASLLHSMSVSRNVTKHVSSVATETVDAR